MARGSSYGDNTPLPPISVTPQVSIPRRATRDLQAIHDDEERETQLVPVRESGALTSTYYYEEEHPLARHRTWLTRLLICMVVIILGALVL
ncbi:MAG TPA: hypothetical protein VF844_00585, partial [Ktedonobacteraceae bacterium]